MARASEVIENIPAQLDNRRISVRDMLDLLRGRSLYLTILVLTLPNLIPFINTIGVTHVTGILLLLFIAQMTAGLRNPWLPRWLLEKRISSDKIGRISRVTLPWLKRLEHIARPRARKLIQGQIVALYGIVLMALTFILLMPIPLFNVLPAFFMTVITLGLFQRDGIVTVVGTAGSLAFMAGLFYALVMLGGEFISTLFA